MSEPRVEEAPYLRLGPPDARTPLVVAVPHAGRVYPPALLAAARLPRASLETIEDRFADLLIADAVAAGAVAIVARHARALVDLNRDPREIDPAALGGAAPDAGWIGSDKVAGGLGVVPTRIAAGGALWRGPIDPHEFERRIAAVHRPYHQAVAAAMATAQARHGVAVLIDCHSMPPLADDGATPGGGRATVVIGDRHGGSAAWPVVDAALHAVRAAGFVAAHNMPYAGGFTLDRHGRPGRGRHAIQVEIDRSLYLDPALRRPGPGLARSRRLVAAIGAAALAAVAVWPLAAE